MILLILYEFYLCEHIFHAYKKKIIIIFQIPVLYHYEMLYFYFVLIKIVFFISQQVGYENTAYDLYNFFLSTLLSLYMHINV